MSQALRENLGLEGLPQVDTGLCIKSAAEGQGAEA